jgi:hypothetical protein
MQNQLRRGRVVGVGGAALPNLGTERARRVRSMRTLCCLQPPHHTASKTEQSLPCSVAVSTDGGAGGAGGDCEGASILAPAAAGCQASQGQGAASATAAAAMPAGRAALFG